MSTAGMLAALVLIVVLPCAIILCFFLHCYADYLRRNDIEALEAFRVQAQERRMMRQQQILRGRSTSPTSNHQIRSTPTTDQQTNKLSTHNKNIKVSDFFYFHTIHNKQDGDKSTSILWKDKQNTDKAEGKIIESDRQENTAAEPDGFRPGDDDYDSDGLELCIICAPKTTNHSARQYQSFKDRFFGGTSVSDNEKKKTKTSSTPISPADESAETRINDSLSRKQDGVQAEDCCCICLEGYVEGDVICTTKQKQGDCNHIFHKECLFEWIKQNHDCCPLCRVVLID